MYNLYSFLNLGQNSSGIFIIIFLFFLSGVSYYLWSRGNIYQALFCVVLLGLGLRVFCAQDPMVNRWDERYHALVSKNMIEQPLIPKLYEEHHLEFDYRNWNSNEVWLHKQPVPLWTMALSMKVFGVSEFTLRLPSVILSSLCILMTFWIAFLLFQSYRIGIIAAFLQSVNGLVIELASGRVATDHIDTFFLFFVELSILFLLWYTKGRNSKSRKSFLIISGIACGLAILTKWLPALIILPLYIVLNFREITMREIIKDLAILFVVALAVAVPWQVYAYFEFPREYIWEQYYNLLHVTEGLGGQGQPWWYFVDRIRINVNELIYVIILWFGFFVYKRKKYLIPNIFLIVYITIPFLFFSVTSTKMQGYILFIYPAFFIVIALFIDNLMSYISNKRNRYNYTWLFYLLIVSTFALAFRYCLERVKPFENQHTERKAKEELLATEFLSNSIVFNAPCPIEFMFYTNCSAYSIMPDDDLIESLKREGYTIYLVYDSEESERIALNMDLQLIELPHTLSYCNEN